MTMSETLAAIIYENEGYLLWEKQNEGDPNEGKYKDAAYELGQALSGVSEAYDQLATAAEKVEGTYCYDRISSYLDDLDKIETEIRSMRDKMEKGRCE